MPFQSLARTSAILGLALAWTLCAGGAQGRALTAKDLAALDRLSDPQVSPDGRLVAYDLRTVDYEANKSSHALWLLDFAEPPVSAPALGARAAGTPPIRAGRRTDVSSISSPVGRVATRSGAPIRPAPPPCR